MSCYIRKEDVVRINLASVDYSYNNGFEYDVEYFIIHEIRHKFQMDIIKEYNSGIDTCVPIDIIKKWIYENNNYVTALDVDGNENPKYFEQDSEMDAYAFSYALMKYKYEDKIVSKLYLPEVYKNNEEFLNVVEEFLTRFKEIDANQKWTPLKKQSRCLVTNYFC